MRPGESYAPTGFFGSICSTISSCIGLLCCCWLFRDCFGNRRGPSTPLMAPPQDDRLGHSRGPNRPSGGSKPPSPAGPMHDRLEHLGGPHSPFTPPGPHNHLEHLGGPHSPFGASNPPRHNPFQVSGPHSPFGVTDAPSPPAQHRRSSVPEPPRVPGVQPGIL